MAKNKADKPSKKIQFSEFNPCRPTARGRHSERVFWVEELINANGRHYKDIFETAANKWAKAMVKSEGGEVDEYVELYKNNIPGTPSDTKRMLETLIPMVEKKFGQTLSYEFDDDGDITVEFTKAKASKKSKTEAKPAKATKKVKAAAKDEDEDEEEEDNDEDEDEEDEDED